MTNFIDNYQKSIDTKTAVHLANVSRTWLYNRLMTGKIKGQKIHGVWFVDRQSLQNWIDRKNDK